MRETMERKSNIRNSIVIICVVCSMILPTSSATDDASNDLRVNFYQESCPQAEDIIAKAVIANFRKDPGSAAGVIRLAFHDCFVYGCDASIMLDETPSGERTERDSPINGPLMRGLNVIDQAKEKLEEECPGIVSCADVIQFAARDSIVITGLYHYDVPAGRRDGLVSLEKDAEENMPLAVWSVGKMIDGFKRKGLDAEDLVVLSGAHSVGSAHCPTFYYRQQQNDPKLSPNISQKMKDACSIPNSKEMIMNNSLPFDPHSPHRLDAGFYSQLMSSDGLLESDQVLTLDHRTVGIVNSMASPRGRWKDEKFVNAMIKMGKIEVKTGTQGEIRKNPRYVNGAARSADLRSATTLDINMGPFGNLFSGFFTGSRH